MQHLPARTWGFRPWSRSLGLVAGALTALVPACARRPAPQQSDTVALTQLSLATTAALATVTPKTTEGERAGAATPNAEEPAKRTCPTGMILVDGDYCPEVEQPCLEWMDPPGSRYHHFRCARYGKSVCKSKERVHLRYCIDATERTERDSKLPRHLMSWTSSKKLCEAEGSRLCRESEWQFACEGEEMRPYPYGWERRSSACNVDRSTDIGKPGRLVDHRAPVASYPECASPFGVQDMAGNVEEWVQADGRTPTTAGTKMGWKEVLKGSWWIPSRHACRQFQVGHDDVYNGAETGTRCCKDAD